ncbi:hypothetical protein A8709_17545 [Paenibacillus pectinilyticus]|uniref:DNA-binding response regulator n=1 Tax=Paenibacillus pectinilyticus TaxID=512399 RepID=A0A1C0ZZ70_9BACL|nr:hypothetical protein A8709_17545 [Paenibacillus pectinilyticus]
MYRVLIVDDEMWIRSSLEKKVNEIDTMIVSDTASNGQLALEWLETHYADICITDVRMPLMNGLELMKQINERFPWMASIVISSYDDFYYAKESIQIGALDYLLKPVETSLLQDALMKAAHKTNTARYHLAFQILLKKLPSHRRLMEQWVGEIHMIKYDSMPTLVIDTLEMLQSWVGDAYYLLDQLATAWVDMVCEEFRTEKFQIQLDITDDAELGEKMLTMDKVRSYYRLCAVKKLEEGSLRLYQMVKSAKENPTRKVINDIKHYLEEHYAEKVSLQDIADYANISRTYMAGLFKHETGITVWDYLIAMRLRKAKELLMTTSKKIYEISADIGYENIVYFSKLFKEHYGCSPLEYKKRMEIKPALEPPV